MGEEAAAKSPSPPWSCWVHPRSQESITPSVETGGLPGSGHVHGSTLSQHLATLLRMKLGVRAGRLTFRVKFATLSNGLPFFRKRLIYDAPDMSAAKLKNMIDYITENYGKRQDKEGTGYYKNGAVYLLQGFKWVGGKVES